MAILKTSLAEGEARYHALTKIPGGRTGIVRKWEYVDALSADTLLLAAPSTVTDPKVDGQTYTGTFYVKMEIGEGKNDRSVTIYQTLWLDTGIARFQSLTSTLRDDISVIYEQYAVKVEAPADSQGNIYQANNSINDNGTYSSRLDYQVSNAKTTAFTAMSSFFKVAEDIMYDNSRTAIDAPASGAGGIYRVAGQRQNPDGTYSADLIYTYGTGDGTYLFHSEDSSLRDADRRIYTEYPSPAGAPVSGQGSIYQASNRITDEGTYEASVDYIKSHPAIVPFDRSNAVMLVRKGVLYENQTTPVAAAAAGVGKIYDSANRVNQDGTYSSDFTYAASQPADATFTSRDSILLDETQRILRNQSSAISGGAGSIGNIYVVNQDVNQDGTYSGDVRLQTRTPAQHSFTSRDAKLRTDLSVIYRGAATPIAGGAAAVNYSYNTSQQPQDDGTYIADLTYSYARPDSIYDTFNARAGTGWFYSFRNQEDPSAFIDALPVGGQNSVSLGQNTDGSYDGTVSHLPSSSGIAFWSDFERHYYDYQTKDYEGSLTDIMYKVDHWAIYNTFSSSATTSAENCAGSYKTNVSKMGPVWMATYWRPVDIAEAWTQVT